MTDTTNQIAIETLLSEDRLFPPSEEFRAQANVSSEEIYERASRDLERLWAEHNLASDGTTHVEGEYLEVVATKK